MSVPVGERLYARGHVSQVGSCVRGSQRGSQSQSQSRSQSRSRSRARVRGQVESRRMRTKSQYIEGREDHTGIDDTQNQSTHSNTYNTTTHFTFIYPSSGLRYRV
jgi:hypothetical protein